MGEAKRKRQANVKLLVQDPLTGEVHKDTRSADDLNTWSRHFMRTAARIKAGERIAMQVPCGQCRACCYIDTVEVRPTDDVAHLETEPDPQGWLKLRKNPDGSCIHLGEHGCTVYQHRPAVCRAFDCRMYAMVGVVPKWEDASGNEQPAPTWVFEPPRSRNDKIYSVALRMAVWRYVSKNPSWTVDGALQAAAEGALSEKAAAIQLVDMLEKMPAPEREKWYAGQPPGQNSDMSGHVRNPVRPPLLRHSGSNSNAIKRA